jgi:hypothetical protein
MTLWALHDSDPELKRLGCRPVGDRDPHELNRQGFGIFTPVNVFRGARRIANLVEIRAWFAETDGGDKPQAMRRIARSPIPPSIMIETKRGYHLWWLAGDATVTRYRAIVADRLLPFFGADPAVHDIARVLRVPGFLHMKDPADPFLVQVVGRTDAVHREVEMLEAFPDFGGAQRRLKQRRREARARIDPQGSTFWERAYSLDAEIALARLSGHPAVGGESYEFRRLGNGNLRIVVNGELTGCWIDERGKIGSCDRGGPGVAQWLKWFGHSYREVRRILLDLFPDLEERAA